MYLTKSIRVDKSKVILEDGIRVKLPKEEQLQTIKFLYHANAKISVSEKTLTELKEQSEPVLLDFVNEVNVVSMQSRQIILMKANKRESKIDGWLVDVMGVLPGTIVRLTGRKLCGLYPENSLCILKEGQVLQFGNLLKIRIANADLILE